MADPDASFETLALTEVGMALSPLAALTTRQKVVNFFRQLGWELPAADLDLGVADLGTLPAIVEQVQQATDPLALAEAVSALFEKVQTIFASINSLPVRVRATFASSTDFLNNSRILENGELARRLADYIITLYLQARFQSAFNLLHFLGLIELTALPAAPSQHQPAFVLHRVQWKRFPKLFSNPTSLFEEVYDWGDTNFTSDLLLERLAMVLPALRIPGGIYPSDPSLVAALDPPSAGLQRRDLRVPLYTDGEWPRTYIEMGLILARASDTGMPPGLGLLPYLMGSSAGNFSLSERSELFFSADVNLDTGLALILLPGEGLRFRTDIFAGSGNATNMVDGTLTIGVRTLPTPAMGSNEIVIFGQSGRSRLATQRAEVKLVGRLKDGDGELDVSVAPTGTKLFISGADFDGFLARVLPSDPLTVGFDFGLGWSNRRGLYFHGGTSLERTFSLQVELFSILKVDSIYLALLGNPEANPPRIRSTAAITANFKLGPFMVGVERIGLTALLTFPETGGNFGPLDVALGFKPPDGAGLAIDAGAVVGGGYLSYDLANEQYTGLLQLEVKGGIALKAVGLLTTRLPGLPPGTKGFSLLVIITGEFPPIQLGFGFALTGAGGLLGVNRTMVLEVLRSGIKNHTLDSVLFPQNPVERAPQIISDLQSVFPPVTGQFVFGPMAKLAWGKPATILTIELGIVLEFPSPLRLAIMGQLTLVLPSQEVPVALQIVVLRMDVLGAIDFDKGDASLDATLYDSSVYTFPISGDMAMRLNWGASPTFVLAAGGFNPRLQPPPNFPTLERLAISLATGDNPRLRLESYLAMTSNTVQFGARLDLYAARDVKIVLAKVRITVEAYLGFDALVQLPPLSFIVDIYGGAAIKINGNAFLAILIHVTLSGFTPLQACGEATIVFLGAKRRIPVDLALAGGELPPPPPSVDVLAELRKAVSDRRNWSAQLPSDGHALVTLRKIAVSNEVLVHPLGELTIRQKVVPLDVAISKFGSATPDNTGPFTITSIRFGTQTTDQPPETVKDYFAPGQFFDLSDEEKLSLSAFQPLPSGRTRIGTAEISCSSNQVPASFQYDTVVVDKKEERVSRKGKGFEYPIAQGVLIAVAELGAAGQSAMRSTGSAKFAGSSHQRVTLKDPEYVVASTDDMTWDTTSQKPSHTEAEAARRKKGAASAKYQVVGRHEVV